MSIRNTPPSAYLLKQQEYLQETVTPLRREPFAALPAKPALNETIEVPAPRSPIFRKAIKLIAGTMLIGVGIMAARQGIGGSFFNAPGDTPPQGISGTIGLPEIDFYREGTAVNLGNGLSNLSAPTIIVANAAASLINNSITLANASLAANNPFSAVRIAPMAQPEVPLNQGLIPQNEAENSSTPPSEREERGVSLESLARPVQELTSQFIGLVKSLGNSAASTIQKQAERVVESVIHTATTVSNRVSSLFTNSPKVEFGPQNSDEPKNLHQAIRVVRGDAVLNAATVSNRVSSLFTNSPKVEFGPQNSDEPKNLHQAIRVVRGDAVLNAAIEAEKANLNSEKICDRPSRYSITDMVNDASRRFHEGVSRVSEITRKELNRVGLIVGSNAISFGGYVGMNVLGFAENVASYVREYEELPVILPTEFSRPTMIEEQPRKDGVHYENNDTSFEVPPAVVPANLIIPSQNPRPSYSSQMGLIKDRIANHLNEHGDAYLATAGSLQRSATRSVVHFAGEALGIVKGLSKAAFHVIKDVHGMLGFDQCTNLRAIHENDKNTAAVRDNARREALIKRCEN